MSVSITLHDERIRVLTPYNPIFVERFKGIPKFRYEPLTKAWTWPATKESLLAICDVTGTLPWMLDADLQAVVREEGFKPPEALPIGEAAMLAAQMHEYRTKPFEHQVRGLARLLQHDRWLIADEMGCGKSHIICNRISVMGGFDSVLVLCPKSVTSGWVDQLKIHSNVDSLIVQGDSSRRKNLIEKPKGPIRIANYELLLHSDFSAIEWDAIILDEVHRVKNFTAKTSKLVRALTAKARCVYGLSGTPAPNGLEDWFGVLSAIDPTLIPTKTKTAFEARYCLKREIQPGLWKVAGYKNVAELHGFIGSITSRVTKAECLDLPAKVYSTRTAELQGDQARIYRELKKSAIARIGEAKDAGTLTIRNVITEGLRLLQVCGGFCATDEGPVMELTDNCKLSILHDVLAELGDKQAVIWCAFKAEVELLSRWLAIEYNCEVSVLTGENSQKERDESIEKFRGGTNRFFVGTAAAGGTGINGLQVADTVIYYSRNYTLTEYLQSQDRLHRIGQKGSVHVIKLIVPNTVDAVIDAVLDRKADMQEMMLKSPGEMF